MNITGRTIIWPQFGAAIDMLDNALRACPDELEPAGLPPERPYTKDELQVYLDYGRKKCQATIEALTDETAQQRCRFRWGELSLVELLLYNMRHVQEHAAQLNLMLGQKVGSAPDWVTRARSRAA